MKSITFTADEFEIERARQKARSENTSLNQKFREWLAEYTNQQNIGERFDAMMERLNYAHSGGPYTREEMNER